MQFGQGGINFEDEHEKTTVEAWFRPKADATQRFDSETNIYKNQGMIFG